MGSTHYGTKDAFIIKCDINCMVVPKVEIIGAASSDEITDIDLSPVGDIIYAVGQTDGNLDGTNSGFIDIFIASYTQSLTKRWIKLLGTPTADRGYGIAVSPDSNYIYITGYTKGVIGTSSSGRDDIVMAKYDKNGTKIWTREFGSNGWDRGYSIVVSPNKKCLYITGYATNDIDGQTNNGGGDVLIHAEFTGE